MSSGLPKTGCWRGYCLESSRTCRAFRERVLITRGPARFAVMQPGVLGDHHQHQDQGILGLLQREEGRVVVAQGHFVVDLDGSGVHADEGQLRLLHRLQEAQRDSPPVGSKSWYSVFFSKPASPAGKDRMVASWGMLSS